jgi:D12 class N6 adenine-specific DNA methyltransferase
MRSSSENAPAAWNQGDARYASPDSRPMARTQSINHGQSIFMRLLSDDGKAVLIFRPVVNQAQSWTDAFASVYLLDMRTADGCVISVPTLPKAIVGIPHPIAYQGSKRQLARWLVGQIPLGAVRLVEPFAGSAAVSLAAARLRAAQAFVLNDIHSPLIELWRAIVKEPERIASAYRRHWNAQTANPRRYYDLVRAEFNCHHRPADFLYLLARCIKAAIRYNSRGEFNNSPDNRRRGAHPDTMQWHIEGASRLLAGRSAFTSLVPFPLNEFRAA